MPRTYRTLLIAIATLAVIGGVVYTANSFDLVGVIVRMHVPPAH